MFVPIINYEVFKDANFSGRGRRVKTDTKEHGIFIGQKKENV